MQNLGHKEGAERDRILEQKRKNKRTRIVFLTVMLGFPLLHFAVFFVYININTVLMTFQRINWANNTLEYGFYNYKRLFTELFQNAEIWVAMKNSFWNMLCANFVLLPLSAIFGYFIFRKIRLSGMFRVIFFFPSIVSVIVMTMVFSFMFSDSIGPINAMLEALGVQDVPVWFADRATAFPMVLFYTVWAGIGFNIVLLNGSISRLPQDTIEYGRLEGIGMARELFQIIIPMIWPTVTTLMVLGATGMFTMFLPVKLLTNGNPNGASATIGFYINNMVKGGNVQLEWAATLGLFFSIVGIPIIFGIKRAMEKFGPESEY